MGLKNMLGTVLIIFGIAGIVLGCWLKYDTPRDSVEKVVQAAPHSPPKPQNPENENKQKGDAFEAYIIALFNKHSFTLKEWRGDKYVGGIYPESSTYPDLEIELKLGDTVSKFCIECKWRSDFYQMDNHVGIQWATKEQIGRYKRFEHEKKLPVFVAIGVGNSPSNPKELFVLPLDQAKYPFLWKTTLDRHARDPKSKFFYDYKTKSLK